MKYLGSKRYMLKNGLGAMILGQIPNSKRLVDPFCGSCSVVEFFAKNGEKPVIAADLQEYAVVLARSIVNRAHPIPFRTVEKLWLSKARTQIQESTLYRRAVRHAQTNNKYMKKMVLGSRELCTTPSSIGPVWNAYGGHYFSPTQAITIDYLIRNLPSRKPYSDICLASIIIAASRCVASPGHTAQPFQPTITAKKYIRIAWNLDFLKACETALREVLPIHSKKQGSAEVCDVLDFTSRLQYGDLVVLDPPYSGVQYSRFYHVLETIAKRKCGPVTGVGRYPAITERPQSSFSLSTQSHQSLIYLLDSLGQKGATVILTFPSGQCSNGLSGDDVISIATMSFNISKKSRIAERVVTGQFSTLGGNNKVNHRLTMKAARVNSEEQILLLKPK